MSARARAPDQGGLFPTDRPAVAAREEGWAVWGPPGDESSLWRLELGRRWDSARPLICWIGYNPSTATALVDDATVRRWRGFSESNGAGGFVAVNLHDFRSTDPKGLWAPGVRACSSENNAAILRAAASAMFTIACWGALPDPTKRGPAVRRLLADAGIPLHVMRLTKGGAPAHVLYLPGGMQPVLWEA